MRQRRGGARRVVQGHYRAGRATEGAMTKQGDGPIAAASPQLTPEDQRLLELVKQASARVKPLVEEELANEVVTQEMLAFRLT